MHVRWHFSVCMHAHIHIGGYNSVELQQVISPLGYFAAQQVKVLAAKYQFHPQDPDSRTD